MLRLLKQKFDQALSIGLHPDMGEAKKLAIRISTLDGYWSLIVISFYICMSYFLGVHVHWLHWAALFIVSFGIWMMKMRWYDSARVLIHCLGLVQIFLSADALPPHSGAEFFYFTSIAIPFVTFTLEEQWKGLILTFSGCAALIFQEVMGTGLIMTPAVSHPTDRVAAILFVISYFLLVFGLTRKQLRDTQKQLELQQQELFHSSKMIAMGEMASGIAHEINNPLLSLSLQLRVIREKFQNSDFDDSFNKIDVLISKMGKMVHGLRELSRKETKDQNEIFPVSKVIDDVMEISANRIDQENIRLSILGDTCINTNGLSVQISQVLINLLNNSIDALRDEDDKWIKIEVVPKSSFVELSVTDSGPRIEPEVARQMMNPFYTTKRKEKGTGLGLSISKTIVENNRGSLYYDQASLNTKFVLLLPRELEGPKTLSIN